MENYSTLKLHPNGLVEYTALQPEKGLEILETGKNNLYESLNAAIDFTEQLLANCHARRAAGRVRVLQPLEEAQSNTYSFTFDYMWKGTQVIVDLLPTAVGHAVEIEMKDGKITRFCFFLREYESVPAQEEAITMLQAIDMIYEEFSASSGETVIQDIFQSFYEDGSSDQHNALWTMKVNGNYQIIKGKNAS